MNSESFIRLLYKIILNREADAGGLSYWVASLDENTPADVIVSAFLDSEEFKSNCHDSVIFQKIISAISSKPPTIVSNKEEDDLIDALRLKDLKDDWDKFENILRRQHEQARTDANLDAELKTLYLNEDREEAFSRYLKSNELLQTKALLNILGVDKSQSIIEVGGGAGYLTWALSLSGYNTIELLESNPSFTSGTGYLSSRQDAKHIRIFNDLDEWHQDAKLYDLIITKNCIHHFRNPAYVGGTLRQKLKNGGRWIALREWFADTASELSAAMETHYYGQKYDLYEWPFPAATYVEAFAMVGLELTAVIPYDYADNAIGTYQEDPLSERGRLFTDEIDAILKSDPLGTVRRFWIEHYAKKAGSLLPRLYTRPQAMIFEKVPVALATNDAGISR